MVSDNTELNPSICRKLRIPFGGIANTPKAFKNKALQDGFAALLPIDDDEIEVCFECIEGEGKK